MKNDLKKIYSALSTSTLSTTQLINSDEMLKWIPILDCGKSYKNMGLSEKGYWAIKIASGLCLLTESRSYLYVMVLLEKPMNEICKRLTDFFHSVDPLIVVDEIFPFAEITEIGLEQRDEYWVELAFNWYDEISFEKKMLLKDSLIRLANSKRASQKLRHKAFKEVKRLTRNDLGSQV